MAKSHISSFVDSGKDDSLPISILCIVIVLYLFYFHRFVIVQCVIGVASHTPPSRDKSFPIFSNRPSQVIHNEYLFQWKMYNIV